MMPKTMNDRKRAFFIDDDQDFLEGLQDLIDHPRFEVVTYLALNGYRAIDEVIKQQPDVLFIDFNLPRANGGQILPVLRSIGNFSEVPVYFVTGHSREEVERLFKDVAYDGILEKSDTLPQEIVKILDSIDHSSDSSD